MELMWLVYAVENLTYNGEFFFSCFTVLLLISASWGVVWLIALGGGEDEDDLRKFKPPVKSLIAICFGLLSLHTLLPTKQTAIYMAGAYLAQQVYSNDKTQKIGNKVYNLTIQQLDKWSDEVPELKVLVGDKMDEVVEKVVPAAKGEQLEGGE